MEKIELDRLLSELKHVQFEGDIWRVAQSQEQNATNSLVNNLDDQAILEEMLDVSKPQIPKDCHGLDYLFMTPFRYAPLPNSSRFGLKNSRGIFYASVEPETSFAEVAYYKLVFLNGMTEPFASPLKSEHTLFSTKIKSDRTANLQYPPFGAFEEQLTSPSDYTLCQSIGESLREVCDVLLFKSARCPAGGINIAIFSPQILQGSTAENKTQWLCEVTDEKVTFLSRQAKFQFPREFFLLDGYLPTPAT